MTINVLNFYSNIKNNENLKVFHSPIFYILVKVNGKLRELTLKLAGEVRCPAIKAQEDFKFEGCRDYIMITDFLLSNNGERVRGSWGLTKEDFRELIFELYFTLVKEHSKCSTFRRACLLLFGVWKFFIGKRL